MFKTKLTIRVLSGCKRHLCTFVRFPVSDSSCPHACSSQGRYKYITRLHMPKNRARRMFHWSEPINMTEIPPSSSDKDTSDFGTLAKKQNIEVFRLPSELRYISKIKDDEEVVKKKTGRQSNTPYWYHIQCKHLANKRKTSECVNFLEQRMLKEDRVQPQEFNFTVVIGAVGRIGDSKKAFHLYSKMKDYGLQPTIATYTALFNSVACSSYKLDINRAMKLYAEIKKKKKRLNRITYNAAIKAFGKHGTIQQMMGIFRESMAAGFEPDSDTFNMIMMSLDGDREVGSLHAIQVFRQMLKLDIKPSGKTLMYFLKVLKSCDIGDTDIAFRKLISEEKDPNEQKHFFKKHLRNVYWLKGQESLSRTKLLEESDPHKNQEMMVLIAEEEPQTVKGKCDLYVNEGLPSASLENSPDIDRELDELIQSKAELQNLIPPGSVNEFSETKELPNLITLPFENCKTAIPEKIAECKKPWQRLHLVGGHTYIFQMMKKYDIEPTTMLLSTLARVLEPSVEVEDEVMTFAENSNAELDIDFYNCVLLKRARRMGYRQLKPLLQRISDRHLTPNIRTWCIVALSCSHANDGLLLIQEMKKASVEPTLIFYNSLIGSVLKFNKFHRVEGYEGKMGYNYRYLSELIQEMKKSEITPDQHTIRLLEIASDWPQKYIRWNNADPEFEKKVFGFRNLYNKWLLEVEVQDDLIHSKHPSKY